MGRYRILDAKLDALKSQGLARQLRPLTMTGATTGLVDGRPVDVFSSNDYLGLAHHPKVKAAFAGAGVGASRLISGDRPAHHALEQALEEVFERPVTLFNSGYNANLALASVVLDPGAVVASDALNHASIIDGLRLSRATRHIMPHGDPHLPDPCQMAVVEGVYSMDGDVLNLAQYQGDHWLCVDEAHAVGALGPHGRGEAARQGITPDFIVGTLGKAYGAFGAFIVGPPQLRELLISKARTFIFTTGLPEPVAAAALSGLALANDERRQQLADNTERFRQGLAQVGITALGDTHIVPIVLGPRTMDLADALLARGVFALGIRPPTVAQGSERIRFSLSAAHTADQIDRLLETLHQLLGSQSGA